MNIPPSGQGNHQVPTAPQGNERTHGKGHHRGPNRTEHAQGRGHHGGPSASSGDTNITTQQGGGVLALLQQGHFQSVAQTRLSINFSAQLSAIGQQAQGDSILGGLADLLAAVTNEIASFLETAQPGESISIQITVVQETFVSTTQQLADDFISNPSPGIESLFDGIQALFDELEEALISILSPADGGEAGDGSTSAVSTSFSLELSVSIETVSVTSGSSALSDEFQAFIDSIREAFDDAFAAFSDAVTSTGVLAAPFAANGNGGAFDKFLAILNDLGNDNQSGNGDNNTIVEA